jgi:hypothetical protein
MSDNPPLVTPKPETEEPFEHERGVILISVLGIAAYALALAATSILAFYNYPGALGSTLTLVGIGGSMGQQVFNWWLGSSTGSAKKDSRMLSLIKK